MPCTSGGCDRSSLEASVWKVGAPTLKRLAGPSGLDLSFTKSFPPSPPGPLGHLNLASIVHQPVNKSAGGKRGTSGRCRCSKPDPRHRITYQAASRPPSGG